MNEMALSPKPLTAKPGELRDIDPNDIAFSRFPALPEGMEAEAVEVVIRLRKKRAAGAG